MQVFHCQGLAKIAWSYLISNVLAAHLFDCGFITALLDREHEFIDAEFRQLHQWQLWQLELRAVTKLLQLCCNEEFILGGVHSSGLQDDVVHGLTSIGLKLQEEMLLPSGYQLDAYVMVNVVNVGVEVDGLCYFTGHLPNGHTQTILKRCQVSNIDGAMIVSVLSWEWAAPESIHPRRQEYLSYKLWMNQAFE
jgi:hypothetical protein